MKHHSLLAKSIRYSIYPALVSGMLLNSNPASADCITSNGDMTCSGTISANNIDLTGLNSLTYSDGQNAAVDFSTDINDATGKSIMFDGDSSINSLSLSTAADVLNLNAGSISQVNTGGGGDTINIQGATVGTLDIGSTGGGTNSVLVSSGNVGEITSGANTAPTSINVTGGTVDSIYLKGSSGDSSIVLSGGTLSSVIGSAGNDIITLDGASLPGDGAMYGSGLIFGNAGNNTITIKSGDVVDVVGGYGDDKIDVYGGTVSGLLMGGDGNDVITIHGDNAYIAGLSGDFLYDPAGTTPNSQSYHDVLNLDGVTDAIPVNPLSTIDVDYQMSNSYQGPAAGFGFEEIHLQNGSNLTLRNNLWEAGKAVDPTLFVDASSTLNVSGSQTIFGNLDNDGLVNVGTPGSTVGNVLTVDGNLTGSGAFGLNTDLANEQGDLLAVRGTAEGSHTLVIADSGHEPSKGDGQLKVVETGGGAGQFGLLGGHVDAGAYRYTLEQRGADWYLTSPADPVDPLDPVAPVTPADYSNGTNVAINNQIAYATLWAAELDTLTQRLGDLRQNDTRGGLWIRNLSRDNEIDTGSSREFDQNVQGFQIGADKVVGVNGGKWVLGGMVGQTNADNDFGEGAKGNIDSLSFGGYATYLDDSGLYVDTVAKYNKFDSDTKVYTNVGDRVKGKQKTHGYGVSVEVGKRYALDKGWFVEPQGQLSSMHVKGDDYKQTDGLQVESSDVDSLLSRVGVRAGRDFKLDSGAPISLYAKASYITEHGDDSSVRVNGHKFDAELPGSRTEVGVGMNLAASKSSNVYMDVNYAKGNDLETPWALNVGYRYDW